MCDNAPKQAEEVIAFDCVFDCWNKHNFESILWKSKNNVVCRTLGAGNKTTIFGWQNFHFHKVNFKEFRTGALSFIKKKQIKMDYLFNKVPKNVIRLLFVGVVRYQ